MPSPFQFGIEFEFSVRNGNVVMPTLYDNIRAVVCHPERTVVTSFAPLHYPSYRGDPSTNTWNLKPECTCGYELSTPPSTRYNWQEIYRVMDVLRAAGVTVPVTTGMHVHIDKSNLTRYQQRRFVYLWYMFEPVLMLMVRRSRRNSGWCREVRYHELATTPSYADIRRLSRTLNRGTALAYNSGLDATMEVRLHGGSINKVRVNRWVTILGGLYRVAENSRLEMLHIVEDKMGTTPSIDTRTTALIKVMNKFARARFNWGIPITRSIRAFR